MFFAGASAGNEAEFIKAAQRLGRRLAEEGVTLIYGGARAGLMGVVADAVLLGGGRVVGVIPEFIRDLEVAHTGLTELVVCKSMHERKTEMFKRAEGFLALPGGFGTLEEICEVLTWRQLGLHRWPIGFANINGFYDSLSQQFAVMESRELLRAENRGFALFDRDVETLLQRMRAAVAT